MVSFSSIKVNYPQYLSSYSLKDSQKFFMQSLPLHTSYLFSIPSNAYIIDIEYSQGMYSPTFVIDDFSKLFFDPSILLSKVLRSG